MVVGRRHTEFYSFVNTQLQKLCAKLLTPEPMGEMRRTEMRGMGEDGVNGPAPNVSQPLCWMFPSALLLPFSTLLQPAFCPEAHLCGLNWWTLETSGFFWVQPVGLGGKEGGEVKVLFPGPGSVRLS